MIDEIELTLYIAQNALIKMRNTQVFDPGCVF